MIAEGNLHLLGQALSDEDASGPLVGHAVDGVEPAGEHAQRLGPIARIGDLADVGNSRFEPRIDALHVDRGIRPVLCFDQPDGADGRGRTYHPLHRKDAFHVPLVVLNAADMPHVNVCSRAEDPIAQLSLQPGHQGERNDERHHPHRDAKCRDQ